MPQSAAAPSDSTIGVRPLRVRRRADAASAISQMPASAGSRNQAKRGRGCSPSTSHAPDDRDERLHLLQDEHA